MTKSYLIVYFTLRFLASCFHILSVEVEDSHDLDAQDRVIGGRSCSTKQYSFMVLVIKTRLSTSYRICGGTLIKPGWVLTAAHCMDDSVLNSYSVIITASTHKKTISVKEHYTHPNYDKINSHLNDIALLELASELDAHFDIELVILPKPEDPDGDPICEDGLILGWGKMESSEVPEITNLQCGDVELIPSGKCKDMYDSLDHTRIYKSQICTSSDEGVQPYLGDSGGPLMCGEVQVGIVSWGMGKRTPFPVVFTKVRDHLDFIHQERGRSSDGTYLRPILFLTIFMLLF